MCTLKIVSAVDNRKNEKKKKKDIHLYNKIEYDKLIPSQT